MANWFDPNIKSADLLTGPQRALLDQIANTLREQFGKGVEPYGGTVVPGSTPGQEKAFGYAGGEGELAEAHKSALLAALNPNAPSDITPERYRDTIGADFLSALNQAWGGNQKLALEHKYGSSGAAGAVPDALARSFGESVAVPYAQARSGAALTGLEAMRGSRESALMRALGATGAADQSMMTRLAIGGEQRAQSGQKLSEEYEKWAQAQGWNNPWVSQFLGPALGTSAIAPIVGQSGHQMFSGSMTAGMSNK